MRILNWYVGKVLKVKFLLLLILIPFIIYYAPFGYNAYNYISNEIGVEDLGTDQAVLTFTSLTDDVIFILNGEEGFISQSLYNWTSSFAFDLQNNRIIQQYALDATPIEHVFDTTQQLLSDYYVSIHSAIGFVNVTTYIIIEGTRQFIDYWRNADNLTKTNQELANEFKPVLQNQIDNLKFGELPVFNTIGNSWLNQISDELSTFSRSDIIYPELASKWQSDPESFEISISSRYHGDFYDLLASISQTQQWEENGILDITSMYLFGKSDQNSIDFLVDIFAGSLATRPITLAQQALLPFLRTEFIPPGLPETVRDYYLSAFTNSDGSTEPTSMIIRFRLSPDLTEQELEIVFQEMNSILDDVRQEVGDEFDIGFLSFLNYQRERSQIISEEMHRVDLISIIIGTLILLAILRNIWQSGLIVLLAWTATQATRGFFISITPIIGNVNGTSFSIATTFLLGASMNYTVFYAFRYFQERSDDKTHSDAVSITSQTALHSVLISGIAIILSMLPYTNSSTEILEDLSKSVVWLMLIQIVLLLHVLPIFFSTLSFIEEKLKNKNFEKLPTLSFNLDLNKVKNALSISIIAGIIGVIVIASLNSSFVANDVIGDSGETGYAIGLLEESYPEDYLSKYLISLDVSGPIEINGEFNSTIISEIDEITTKISQIADMKNLLSIAWPLGESFNYTDNSVGQVDYLSAVTISEQLIENNNRTFIIIQSAISSNSGELAEQSTVVQSVVDEVLANSLTITDAIVSGLPAEIAELTERTADELPGQILLALVLITVFLTLVLGSVFNPLRLEFTIILATIYSIAIASLLYKVFTDVPLNIVVISSSFLILLGLGTDFDIYLYRRIKEEQEEQGIDFISAIDKGVESSAPAIMSSGLVMAFSFLSLFYSDISLVRQFGAVTFITILIDIFVVRTIIVPAILIYFHKEELIDL